MGSEFQGSVLITGNMKMATTGHSGRTIVLGNIEHNKGGSEFHNYEYDPPVPLPEPDCEDYLSGGLDQIEDAVEELPTSNPVPAKTPNPKTPNPTNNPTNKPTQAPTKAAPSAATVYIATCRVNGIPSARGKTTQSVSSRT